jgi:hypothetical protein
MSDRYWVGGSGVWTASATANWSYTSGGPGGAPVPTSEDNVYIDANSDIGAAFEIRVEGSNPVCKSLYIFPEQFLEFVTLSYGFHTLSIYGGLSCTGNSSLLSFDGFYRGELGFYADSGTYIINTNGLIFLGDFSFGNYAGSTAVYELLSDFNMRGDKNSWISGSSGTVINTNGHTLYLPAGQCYITINGNGTIYTSAGYCEGFIFTGGPIVRIDNWGTFEYGSYIQAGGSMFNGCSAVYVEITEPPPEENFFYFNSFNITVPLYIRAPADSGTIRIELGNLTGTMSNVTILDTKINSRVFFFSDYTSSTLTVNSITNVSDIDFEGVSITGAAAPISGTRIRKFRPSTSGTNIIASTFTPKTVYWSNINGGKLSSNSYSFTSGGTPSLSAFPLHLDTVIIDDAGLGEDSTINIAHHDQGPITVFTTFDCSTRTKPFYLGRDDGYYITTYYALKNYNNTITCLSEFKLPLVPCLYIFSRSGFLIGCDLDFNETSTPMNFYGTYYSPQNVYYKPAFLFYRPTTLYTNLDANYVILLNDFNFNSYNVTCLDIDLAGNGGNPTSTVYFGSSTINTQVLSNINIPTCPDIHLLNIIYRNASGTGYIGGNRTDIQLAFQNTIPSTPRTVNSLTIIPSGTFTIYAFFIPTELELISPLNAGALYFRHNQSEIVNSIKKFIVEGPSNTSIGPITLQGSPTKFNYIERNSVLLKNVAVYGVHVYPNNTWYATEGNINMVDGYGWIFDSSIPAVSLVDGDNIVTAGQSSVTLTGTNLSTADGVQIRQGNNILNTTNYVAGSSPTFTLPNLSSIFSSGIKFGSVQLDIMENV